MLERSPWLGAQAVQLAPAMLEHGRLATFGAGSWVHAEGDADTGLFIVIEGAVQLYCQAPGDREVLLGHAEAGAAIGQAARFGGGPRLVTAICVEPSLLLMMPDSALERIARTQPEIWRSVARLGYALLSVTVRIAAETVSLPPRQRLASRLVMLTQRGAGAAPTLRLSQSALAEMLGLTRKTVNAYLQGMAKLGLVEIGYGRIVVRDPAALLRLANS